MTNNKVSKAVRLAIAFGAVSTAAFSTGSFAQDDEQNAKTIEKVTITGSRIRKLEFISNAPVATVESEQFTLTNTINTESLINSLPQFVPGLDRTSNNPGNGTATINLRGLGSNRTLVLMNGTRAVPSGSGGVVDINSIPTALIERVEVLTGGASAIYGADAVAGVVNFIMKDDFEGVQFNTGYEVTEENDGKIFNSDITIGGNFADGKGNVVMNISYTDRDDLFQGDRSFAATALFDDGKGGLEPGGSSGVPATSIFNAGFAAFSPSSGIIFNKNDGSIRPFVTGGDVNDFYNYAPVNYIQVPQERTQFSSFGSYEITDDVEIYGRAMLSDSIVPQQLAPTPIFQTATFTLDGNPYISADAQKVISDAIGDRDSNDQLIDTDDDGIADTATGYLRRRLLEVGPRITKSRFSSFQYKTGVRGFFSEIWGFDGYYQKGITTGSESQLGNVNRKRFQQALLLDLAADPTGKTCQDPSTGGGDRACAPINIFGEGNISPEGANFLKTAVNATFEYEQEIIALVIDGDTTDIFELPGGPIGVAFGYEHRDEGFSFAPSQDLATGDIAGFNGAPPVSGGFDVTSWNTELYLPVFVDESFAHLLDIELAYRTSDYSTVSRTNSYKIAGSYAPIEMLRFRASFNTAVRAPNIGELYMPANEGFPKATDPCSSKAADDKRTADVKALCKATGVPEAAIFTAAIDPPAGQVREIGGGNPNLNEEEAETITFGLVITPMENLSLSIDRFDIEIDSSISAFGGGASNILSKCYDMSFNKEGANSIYCQAIQRRSDGTIAAINALEKNIAKDTLKGVDVTANYTTEFAGGEVKINYLGTYTNESDFIPEPGEPAIRCAGYFGTVCGEPTPSYKHRTTFQWNNDELTLQLLWRHIGKVEDDDDEEDYTIERVSAYNYFDLSGSYSFNDNYQLTFGIDNIADKSPAIMGQNAEQSNTYPATYDVFGRTYSLSFTAKF